MQRWRQWRRPGACDPVRVAAGRWLTRLPRRADTRDVVAELQRLRYGRRETWPEPRSVFKRARQAGRNRNGQ
jgi:hypothetical protein